MPIRYRHIALCVVGLALPAAGASAADEAASELQAAAIPVDGKVRATSGSIRTIKVDLAPFYGKPAPEFVSYDLDRAIAPLKMEDYGDQPEWVLAVRLLLSEVGPDRLVHNHYGVLEAIGILQTVHNRLDPATWNPDGIRGVVPWPGCGPDGTFNSCANPDQYYGLRYPRALDPKEATRLEAELLQAVDLAVEAWWLTSSDVLGDITGGATSFVHRCGGEAYGEETRFCDGRGPTPDIKGAEASTGPATFKGPVTFLPKRGRYELDVTRFIDFDLTQRKPIASEWATYLWEEASTTAPADTDSSGS